MFSKEMHIEGYDDELFAAIKAESVARKSTSSSSPPKTTPARA